MKKKEVTLAGLIKSIQMGIPAPAEG